MAPPFSLVLEEYLTPLPTDKKELGVHTELMTEGIVDLIEAGVITNSQKSLWKVICHGNTAALRFCGQ